MAPGDESPYSGFEPAFITLDAGSEKAPSAVEPHFVLPDFLRPTDGDAVAFDSEAPEKVELPEITRTKSDSNHEPVGPLATTPSPHVQGFSIPETTSKPQQRDFSPMTPQRHLLHTDSSDYQSDTSPQTPLPVPVKVLRLKDIMPEPPSLGTPERPTEGSTNHHLGTCKPCAFVSKPGGCQSGSGCKFCHLCEPGEKQRRRKGRQLVQKAAMEWQRLNVPPFGQGMLMPSVGPWNPLSPLVPAPQGLLHGWEATR